MLFQINYCLQMGIHLYNLPMMLATWVWGCGKHSVLMTSGIRKGFFWNA